MLTAQNTYKMTGLDGLFGWESKWQSVQLGYSLTLAQGTILGEYTPVSDQQTVTITGTPTGGTFTLTYTAPSGQTYTTAAINYNASAANVVTALTALSVIGTGGVTATGGTLPGTPVVVTFAAGLANSYQ